jgi:Ca2+-binding EF-hand superfamily protein
MRSLFQYLDTDHDGIITQECLLQGLSRLQGISEIKDQPKSTGTSSLEENIYPITTSTNMEMCEYEINELMRCVPEADERGGITLKSFLEAEATLLPHLTKLKLLQ